MKNLISMFLSLILLAFLSFAYLIVAFLPDSFGRRTGWVLLGERLLGRDPDLAVIPLQRKEGRPRALQLRVLRAAAGLRALTLRFADGGSERIDLDETLLPGAPSRIIDLPPGGRLLRSLELRWDRGKERRDRVASDPGPVAGESEEDGAGGEPLVKVYGLA
jgi:hypothetical protein